MSNIMKKVPASYKPKHGGPTEYPAFLSKEEMQMLKAMTDGASTRTPYGIPSFENLYGLASPAQTKAAYSAPRTTGPSTSLSAPARTAASSSVRTTGPSTSLSAPARTAPSSSGNGSSAASLGKGGSYSTGNGSSTKTASSGNGSSSAASLGKGGAYSTGQGSNSMLGSAMNTVNSLLSFADSKPRTTQGQEAKWSIGNGANQIAEKLNNTSTVKQGMNYSPADYLSAGYGSYQQPPAYQAPKLAASDWQIGGPQNIDYAKNLQIMRENLMAASKPALPSKASQLAGYDERIPAGDNSQNWTAAAMPSTWATAAPQNNISQMASAYSKYQQPPNDSRMAMPPSWNVNSDPQPIQDVADNSYLMGNKASSAAGYVQPASYAGMGSQGALSSQIADAWARQDSLPNWQAGRVQMAGAYPDGYNPNGPETPSNGIDAMTGVDASPASSVSYVDAPKFSYVEGGNPFGIQPYNSTSPTQIASAGQQIVGPTPSLYGTDTPSIKSDPQGWLGSQMPAVNDKIAGLISPLTSMFGTGDGYPNYSSSTGGQGTAAFPHAENASASSSGGSSVTYGTKDEFAAAHPNWSADKIEQEWQKYLKKNPVKPTAVAGGMDWYYPTYQSGSWANLKKGKGNA